MRLKKNTKLSCSNFWLCLVGVQERKPIVSAMAPGHSTLKRPAACSPRKLVTPKKQKKDETPVEDVEETEIKEEMVSPDPKAAKVTKAAKSKAEKPKEYPKIPPEEAKKMAYKLKALSAKGDTKLKEGYAACRSQQEKRQFYYEHFLLDPSVSEKTVLKKDSEQQRDIEDVIDGWFTMEKIAEYKGILPSCDKYQEKCQACVKGLSSRKHEDQNLADLGVLQYKYTVRTSKKQVRKTKELSLEEGVGQLQTEDFQQIRQALHSGPTQRMIGNKSSGSNKPGLDKAHQNTEEEEQETAEVDWAVAFKAAGKKVKAGLVSVASEIHTCEVMLSKVKDLVSTDPMKVVVEQQMMDCIKRLQEDKKNLTTESLTLAKDPPEDELEHETGKTKAVADKISTVLKERKKELSIPKKWVEQQK